MAKNQVLLSLSFLVVLSSASFQSFNAKQVTPTSSEPSTTTDDNNPSNENPFDPNVCSSSDNLAVCMDCKKISVCLNGQSLPEKECPPDIPYCVGSEMGSFCSVQPDPEREQCLDKFHCTSEGYFPDPYDCHYFYMCDSSLKALRLDCMPGYVFDLSSKNCRRQIFPSDCRKLDCSKSNGVWSYYSTNKQYYGYCYQSTSGSNEVVLFKCGDGAEFDGFQCKYQCRKEGKFADSGNRSRYFECYYVDFKLVARVRNCASGMMFDERTGYCVSQ
ncbi:uncharacterized protein LOC131439243 [Malaya genurostris]|uniref:uncharacterized protein LOC131439243 n=1 Tax=Malaya genurostris TaxID=325434 RepID=UPI0026F39D3E|nr:uncharacterized protein LOC131439243 [Malaya genurostris]